MQDYFYVRVFLFVMDIYLLPVYLFLVKKAKYDYSELFVQKFMCANQLNI